MNNIHEYYTDIESLKLKNKNWTTNKLWLTTGQQQALSGKSSILAFKRLESKRLESKR